MSKMKLVTRIPHIEDGKGVYTLIKNSPPLDVNSEYLYILMCDHFRGSSVVAEVDGKIIGVITGYILPEEPDTLFVWQVCVDGDYRGKKIPNFMFENLLSRENLSIIQKIKTTVSPSNLASKAMFEKLTKKLETQIKTEPYIEKEHFSDGGHEEEPVLTIGPFTKENKEKFYENI